MAEFVSTKIGRIQLLLFALVIIMLLFGGCTRQGPDGDAGQADPVQDTEVPMSGGVDINAIGTGEWMGSQNMYGADSQNMNGTESVVIYGGAAFVSSYRTIGGDSIYCTGFLGEPDGANPAEGNYFIGRIGVEEEDMRQFALEIPGDMFAYRGCIDDQGRWHLYLSQKGSDAGTTRKTEIWVINRQGELEQSIDITDNVKEGVRIPDWMAVDTQGRYYMASGENIWMVDSGKQSVESYHFDGEVSGIGVGRSGTLYGVFNAGGNDFLGIVDTESGSIEKCADFPENSLRPSFSELQAGVNAELLLANKGDGIWRYDGTDLEQALSLEDIAVNGQDILAMGFLWDGRVCVMSYEDGKYVFRYVPAEG